jgi:hypothetical protein
MLILLATSYSVAFVRTFFDIASSLAYTFLGILIASQIIIIVALWRNIPPLLKIPSWIFRVLGHWALVTFVFILLGMSSINILTTLQFSQLAGVTVIPIFLCLFSADLLDAKMALMSKDIESAKIASVTPAVSSRGFAPRVLEDPEVDAAAEPHAFNNQ